MKNFTIIKWLAYLAVTVLLYLIFAFIWLSRTLEHKASESTGHRSLSDQQNIQPDKSYAEALLDQLNNEKVQQDDPRLIKLIRDHFIEPPSPLSYNLLDLSKTHNSQFGQAAVIDRILRNKETGFFIECGAFDGETESNTLFFEKTRHWRGLLIEADPIYYAALKKKNRNAFAINACLSLEPHPVQMVFNRNKPEYGRLAKPWNETKHVHKDRINVQCFPLYSILMALNQTNVDYFSLDIEGDELQVLKTIPFNDLNIKIMTVEVNHPKSKRAEVRAYMESQGHQFVMKIRIDLVFVRNSTKHETTLQS